MPGGEVGCVAGPSRRAVLVGAAAVSLAACTGEPSSRQAPDLPPPPDDLLRGSVADAERTLLALYAATRAQHPRLADRLSPFAARHGRHLAAVESSGPVATPEPSTPATTASASAPPRGDGDSPTPTAAPGPSIPTDPAAAVAALRAAERAAADARIAECQRSEDRALAEILAAVAACEAAHDVLLGRQE